MITIPLLLSFQFGYSPRKVEKGVFFDSHFTKLTSFSLPLKNLPGGATVAKYSKQMLKLVYLHYLTAPRPGVPGMSKEPEGPNFCQNWRNCEIPSKSIKIVKK
jgi:hypothetical protein